MTNLGPKSGHTSGVGEKFNPDIGSVPSGYSSEGLSGVLLGHYTRQTNNATNLKRISIT